MNAPWAIIVMGVAGSGKTTVGTALAGRLGLSFRDGDEFHPAASIAKMSAGTALEDDDRWPWLDDIGAAIGARLAAGVGIVVACSALKRSYRDRLRQAGPLTFVHLSGPLATLVERATRRRGHFLPPSLVAGQVATLEPLQADEGGITVSIEQPVAAMVDEIVRRLNPSGRPA